MRFLVHYGRTFTLLLVSFPLLALSAAYLYNQYLTTKEDVLDIVQTSLFEKKREDLDIYVSYLKREFGEDFIAALRSSQAKRQKAEETLGMMKSSEVKYLYMLYVDKKGRLRYLLDTTKELDDRGEYSQRFIPQKAIWEEAQHRHEIAMAAQKEINKLWMSMAYPIGDGDKTRALLGIDFSHEEDVKINQVLVPLDKMYFFSAIFVVVMFLATIIQLFSYYVHRKKSFIDPLTGMYNRQYLNEFLKSYSVEKFHIVIMDLDHFKQVNDIYGHDAGDVVLQTVSKRIQSVIRRKDTLIRYGGEEFLLLIDGTTKEDSTALAERIRENVKSSPIAIDGHELDATMSIGLNPFPERFSNFSQAVKAADECLYKAKHSGRDRVEVYQEHGGEVFVGNLKSSDVKEALEEDRVFCVYQPIIDLKTMEIQAYELLIRIRGKDGRTIVPALFLPCVVKTKLCVELSKRILHLGFNALEKMDKQLSINLSLKDLCSDEVFEMLSEHVGEDRQKASRLIIEISENENFSETEYAFGRLKALKALGVKIAIDNFGVGYANYEYLLGMNVDVLKIDGSLVRSIHEREASRHVVNAIHQLSHKLNIKTVGEQVESEEELDTLKYMGVDYAQGFLIGDLQAQL